MSSLDIRLPNITGVTETEQLQQIRSYLYQLAPQLSWALNTLESKGSSEVVVQKTGTAVVTEKDKGRDDNFNELKALIVKTANTVNAYYDEISTKLSGEYLAKSDFGEYYNASNAEFVANSEVFGIDFSNYQKLIVNESGSEESTLIRSTNAYIQIGNLYTETDGNPVYGIEIGYGDGTNEDANKFARFTPSALTFYDQNGYELATFGNQMMTVPHDASIGGNLFLGKYKLETKNGIAFKWTGKKGG